jgi:hypothetical protein
MPWISWDSMLRPKTHGGIGFRDMRLLNQALLARQAWHLINFPNTLCAQILKAKYYPNGSLLDTVFTGGNRRHGVRSSMAWSFSRKEPSGEWARA